MKTRIPLLAAAIALLFSMVACSSDDAMPVPSEVQSVVDSYTSSWNEDDGDAFRTVVTDDYMFINARTGAASDVDTQANVIDGMLESNGWNAEDVDLFVAGDGPYYVAVLNTSTSNATPDGVDGMSTFTIIDDGDDLKVSEHIYVGPTP